MENEPVTPIIKDSVSVDSEIQNPREPLHKRIKRKGEKHRKMIPMTETEKKFTEIIAKGGDPTSAAEALLKMSGQNEEWIQSWKLRALAKPTVKRDIVRIANELGVSEENLMAKLFAIIFKPKQRDDIALAGIKEAFRVHGSYAPEKSVNVDLEVQIDTTAYRGKTDEEVRSEIARIFELPQNPQSEG